MSYLFSPLNIKSIRLKNRIVMSPMCQYSAVDGFANDWHLVHLGSRAVGGAALIIQEATAVSPAGRISYGDLGIWKDEHLDKLKQIVSFIRANGAVAGIQLAHAGRKASTEVPWNGGRQIATGENSWQPIAPSPIPFHKTEREPRELSIPEIQQVVDDFRSAAKRAFNAGYQVIEIHAAHGYLVNQFLSPLSNHRTDEYGGTWENRIRFLMDILQAVQEVWPKELPIFVRISATDWEENGWDLEDSIQLAKKLKDSGVDLIDTSTGGLVPGVKIPVGPSYQVPYAEAIRLQTGILTAAVGMITTADQAEDIIKDGKADLVVMARELLRHPYFPLDAARQLEYDMEWPNQYQRAKP